MIKDNEKPLFEGVGFVCGCCDLPYDGGIQWNRTMRLCQECVRHQGTSEMQKHSAHKKLWSTWAAALIARLKQERSGRVSDRRESEQAVSALQTENRDLRTAIVSGPEAVPFETMSRYFETDAVLKAQDQRDTAYRQRDYSMQTHWRIDKRHHAVSPKSQRCSCGHLPCDIPRLMEEEVLALRKWERAQIERARSHRPHGLPDGHPIAREFPMRHRLSA